MGRFWFRQNRGCRDSMQGLIGWPLQKPIKDPNGDNIVSFSRYAPLAGLALAN